MRDPVRMSAPSTFGFWKPPPPSVHPETETTKLADPEPKGPQIFCHPPTVVKSGKAKSKGLDPR